VICQLPRVDQRVLALLWLLAESWSQVTPGGVRLPLTLTHETLGAMIGARRPTVTLALRKLSKDGSIVHQDSGWLLLEPPPEPAATPKVPGPDVAGISLSPWALRPKPEEDPSIVYAGLAETVRQLREQHVVRPAADSGPVTARPDRSRSHQRQPPADLSGHPQAATSSIIMITPNTLPSPLLPSGSSGTRHANGFPRRLVASTTTSSR
jgi:Crp-like helix-turn-helix domain